MAIAWIGVFSYIMVWMATSIGVVAGIPSVVMGLTFLAAGTSIPDLLTSVIVAKHGEGAASATCSSPCRCGRKGSNVHACCVRARA